MNDNNATKSSVAAAGAVLLLHSALLGAACALLLLGGKLLALGVVAALKLGEWLTQRTRASARDVQDVLRDLRARPVLYLRSFDADDELEQPWLLRFIPFLSNLLFLRSETSLVRQLNCVGPVVAVGRPDERIPRLGALRCYASDDAWQDTVKHLMDRAQLIVFKLGKSSSLFWEFEQAMTLSPFTPFLITPQGPDPCMSTLAYHTFADRFEKTFRLHLPQHGAESVLVFHSPSELPKACSDVEEACASVGLAEARSGLLLMPLRYALRTVRSLSLVGRTFWILTATLVAVATMFTVFIVTLAFRS